MTDSLQLRITNADFAVLNEHLLRDDHDEHAALVLCGIVRTDHQTRLLVRQVVLAEDGTDFVHSQHGYKELTSRFIAKWASYCAKENLIYLAAHNHFGKDTVEFSPNDLESHERCYPALIDITGHPVGALVFAKNAVAGDIWFQKSREVLDSMVVIGPRMRALRPGPRTCGPDVSELYDRHVRLFGEEGQRILQGLKVTIMGAGGGGSLTNQWSAHLGVGHLVVIDPDTIDKTNRPRIVGSEPRDIRKKTHKVRIAERVAKTAQPGIRFEGIVGDERYIDVVRKVIDSDVIILAGDSYRSRLLFNAIVHQYMIPGFHVGVHILPDTLTGQVAEIKVESRCVLPAFGGGCLLCNNFIPAEKLRLEGLSVSERRAQAYGDQQFAEAAPEPSVITLNVLSAAHVVNDIMMMFTGLFRDEVELESLRYIALDRRLFRVSHISKHDCLHCGSGDRSAKGRGDTKSLPMQINRPDTDNSVKWIKTRVVLLYGFIARLWNTAGSKTAQ